MDIQWYPGHMAKTEKLIKENIKSVDIVIEIIDARIPQSSKNPLADKMTKGRERILVLNKCDLADKQVNKRWLDHFERKGMHAFLVDSVSGEGIKALLKYARSVMAGKETVQKIRGRINRPVRLMVIGIPNVGKSTFINSVSNRKTADTADKPGVTKDKQWIRIGSDFVLLDTPGILWPKFGSKKTAENLAFIGSIKDETLDMQALALSLVERLNGIYTGIIMDRYGIDIDKGENSEEILTRMALRRGCLLKGGQADLERCSRIFLDEFRGGKLGKISLEVPWSDG